MRSGIALSFLLLLSVLFSCGLRRHEINRITAFHYAQDYPDTAKWLAGVEVYHHYFASTPTNDYQLHKTIRFDRDSNFRGIELQCFNPSGEGEYCEISLMRSEGEDNETMKIDHSYLDPDQRLWVSFHYEQEDGIPSLHVASLEMGHRGDSMEYNRTLVPSAELVAHYRNFALRCVDSLPLTEKIPPPDLNTCTQLVSSDYTITECLSQEDHSYRSTWIDSTWMQGEMVVEKESHTYAYTEEVNAEGLRIQKEWKPDAYYVEKHFAKDDYFPVYQRIVRMDLLTKDTVYHMVMHAVRSGRKGAYTFAIVDRETKSGESPEQNIPIAHTEIKTKTNKYGQVIHFHAIAHTETGHRLEYAYKGPWEKRKVTIDRRTIPEVSGNLVYDFYSKYAVFGAGGYVTPAQKKKEARRAKKHAAPVLPFELNTDWISLAKNRKTLYEKLASPDTLSVYEVYYYPD